MFSYKVTKLNSSSPTGDKHYGCTGNSRPQLPALATLLSGTCPPASSARGSVCPDAVALPSHFGAHLVGNSKSVSRRRSRATQLYWNEQRSHTQQKLPFLRLQLLIHPEDTSKGDRNSTNSHFVNFHFAIWKKSAIVMVFKGRVSTSRLLLFYPWHALIILF